MAERSKHIRISRHKTIRAKIKGTLERPRLYVRRTLKYIEAQLIDDDKNHTILAISTGNKDIRLERPARDNIQAATVLGEELAKKAKAMKITKVVFDRGGYPFHGRIKALADAARKQGLEF